MDVQLVSAIIFIVGMLLFLVIKRKKIALQKILFPLLYFAMYRTKVGLKFMDKFAKKFSKPLKYISYFAILIGFLGMLLITYALVQNVYNLLTKPEAVPGAALVLPFEVKGAFYVPFFYWIASIFVIAVVHEFSHGILARKYGMKIKSSGFAFLGILLPVVPAAFVEPDEKQLQKAPKVQQLGVFAAGPFSNILLAFIILGLTGLIAAPLANTIFQEDGVLITGLIQDYPAQTAGIQENEIVTQIDNTTITTVTLFSELLDNKRSGDSVTIQTNKSTYNIMLGENPDNQTKAYLGVYVQQHTKIKQSFLNKYGKIIPKFVIWFMGLLYWLYVLNLGIGLFNLAPMGPLDGGRMLLVVLQKFFDEKRAKIYWKNIGFFFLALVLINILFAFFR
jgi:membrane-associated protease RseP (regulator of RpoE activity)